MVFMLKKKEEEETRLFICNAIVVWILFICSLPPTHDGPHVSPFFQIIYTQSPSFLFICFIFRISSYNGRVRTVSIRQCIVHMGHFGLISETCYYTNAPKPPFDSHFNISVFKLEIKSAIYAKPLTLLLYIVARVRIFVQKHILFE